MGEGQGSRRSQGQRLSLLADIAKEAAGSLIGASIIGLITYLNRKRVRSYLASIVETGTAAKEALQKDEEYNDSEAEQP